MHGRKVHLHSMLVHSVLALVPLAAAAFVLDAAGIRLGRFGPEVWHFLVVASLTIVVLGGMPATASGILERSHAYVTWSATHKTKLSLSLVLLGLVATELVGVSADQSALLSPLGAMVVVINPCLAFLLGFYGLKMTLGRQSLAGTSYLPDLFREPPVDVLAANAVHMAEPPDVIDILQEMTP